MKKCFGYVRVSTAKQGEGVSLTAQREAILRFTASNDITIIKWFEEKETAAKSGRPEFNAMIRLLKRRKADGVVMHKIDRSARNFADWAKVGDLADAGIDVHFATESLDFRSRGGRLSADIQAVIAADYIRNLRDEIKKGIYGRLNAGLYPFRAPIGYLDQGSGKPKIPDPERAPLIRKAFELYGSGNHSLRTLLKELERLGLRNLGGHPVSKCGLETVLANPFYCGLIRIRKTGEVYPGVHQPLISVNLFETVQDIKAGKAGKKVTRHNHTYRGLFRCGNCNAAMTPELQKGHVYYRCQVRECPTRCVREEALEDAVEGILSRVQLSDDNLSWLMDRFEAWWQKRRKTAPGETATMQLGRIKARLDKLTEAMLDDVIDRPTFTERREKLLLEKLRLEEDSRKARAERDEPSQVRKFLELIKSLAATYISADRDEKREIAQIATSNRVVSGKNVAITPADWLSEAENAITGLIGAPCRDTSRRRHHVDSRQFKLLIALAKSKQRVGGTCNSNT
ncbi:MAG: recombinase family protein [Rhizobiaceae bacterium]|nr:recombinase family protein [Rhizobiaceae bacterium]